MPRPEPCPRAVAGEDRTRLGANHLEDAAGRSEEKASEERRLRADESARPGAQPRPCRRRQIARFRVGEGIGEIIVAVMLEMCRAVMVEGEPEGERRPSESVIDAAPARRMAMNDLVLPGGVPSDEPG